MRYLTTSTICHAPPTVTVTCGRARRAATGRRSVADVQKTIGRAWNVWRLGVSQLSHDQGDSLDAHDSRVLHAAAAAAGNATARIVPKLCAVTIPCIPRRRVQVPRVLCPSASFASLSPFLDLQDIQEVCKNVSHRKARAQPLP